MEENPYSGFVHLMRGVAEGMDRFPFRLGEVISDQPLRLRVAGTEQGPDNLLINEQILSGHVETVATTATTSLSNLKGWHDERVSDPPDRIEIVDATLSGNETFQGKTTVKECLKPGDQVLLLSEDDQRFIVLCKVVKP